MNIFVQKISMRVEIKKGAQAAWNPIFSNIFLASNQSILPFSDFKFSRKNWWPNQPPVLLFEDFSSVNTVKH